MRHRPMREIERLVEVARALDEHVAAAHAEVGRAVLDVRRHVVGLQQKKAKVPTAASRISVRSSARSGVGVDPGAREERRERLEDPPLGKRDREARRSRLGPLHALDVAPSPRSFSSMRS